MEFRNDAEHHRYVLEEGGRVVALTRYQEYDGRLVFPHTEVDPDYEGRGLASQLISQALDDVRARGLRIVPLCPYVRGWIERHADYDDLVDHDVTTRLLEIGD